MENDQDHGVQPITKSLSKIVSTLEAAISTKQQPTESGKVTLPISLSGKGETRRPQSGTAVAAIGGRGVATLRSSPPSVYQADLAMVALFPQPVRSWMYRNEIIETRTGADGQFDDAVLLRYYEPFAGNPQEALDILDTYMQPPERNAVLAEIAMLWEMTSHANSGGDDMKLKFSGYCALLMAYPADVAMETLKRARRFKWFPSGSELTEIADRLVHWRRVTQTALEKTI